MDAGVEFVSKETERLERMISGSRFAPLQWEQQWYALSFPHACTRAHTRAHTHTHTYTPAGGGSISGQKSDEFTKRRNVLRKFEL